MAADSEDALDPALLRPWMTIITGDDGREHIVLSDGWHHIRVDVEAGSLAGGRPVVLRYRLEGLALAQDLILPLRRFLHLCRHRAFARTLFTPERQISRWITLLRVYDAEHAGASQREIAAVLFGPAGERAWRASSDSLRSRVRRLVREARAMAAGGYRTLMRGRRSSPPKDEIS